MSKYFSILRINWIHSLEYRANALIGLFAILSGLFIEYLTLGNGPLGNTFGTFVLGFCLSIVNGNEVEGAEGFGVYRL